MYGGDIYYLSVCSSDSLTRLILADLRGHGECVSELSQWIYGALRDNMNSLDGSSILRSLNKTLFDQGFQAITTAVVISFYVPNSMLYFSYAGHPPALLRKKSGQNWAPLLSQPNDLPVNLPLGVFRSTTYDQDSVRLRAGDRVAIYTDGITETQSQAGEDFGGERLCTILEQASYEDISVAKHNLIHALSLHSLHSPCQDDLTLLLMEVAFPRTPQCLSPAAA